mmetsp:Transcript_4719/g.13195  ORF Transcript_4719/g.13195 Transcript_4719/m.13195 type:complete len:213 (+) Transcript_4719:251-889(+)
MAISGMLQRCPSKVVVQSGRRKCPERLASHAGHILNKMTEKFHLSKHQRTQLFYILLMTNAQPKTQSIFSTWLDDDKKGDVAAEISPDNHMLTIVCNRARELGFNNVVGGCNPRTQPFAGKCFSELTIPEADEEERAAAMKDFDSQVDTWVQRLMMISLNSLITPGLFTNSRLDSLVMFWTLLQAESAPDRTEWDRRANLKQARMCGDMRNG